MLALFTLTLLSPPLFSESEPIDETQLVAEPEALPDKTKIEAFSLLSDDQKAFLKDFDNNFDNLDEYLKKLEAEIDALLPDYIKNYSDAKLDFSPDSEDQYEEFVHSVYERSPLPKCRAIGSRNVEYKLVYLFYLADLLKHPERHLPTKAELSNLCSAQISAMLYISEKIESSLFKNRAKAFVLKPFYHPENHFEKYGLYYALIAAAAVIQRNQWSELAKSSELKTGLKAGGRTLLTAIGIWYCLTSFVILPIIVLDKRKKTKKLKLHDLKI